MLLFAALLRSRLTVWCALLLAGLWPAWALFVAQSPSATADPLKHLLLHYGFIACVTLASVLAFAPLRVIAPRAPWSAALQRHRRLVGVASFVYASLHVAAYVLHHGGWAPAIAELKKPFLLTGLIAFTCLVLLAATSLDRAVRWLGASRWKQLHRLAYVAAGLAAYHQAAARKLFPTQVLWIFLPLAALQLIRLALWARKYRDRRLPP